MSNETIITSHNRKLMRRIARPSVGAGIQATSPATVQGELSGRDVRSIGRGAGGITAGRLDVHGELDAIGTNDSAAAVRGEFRS
jgi:hypothetical protein